MKVLNNIYKNIFKSMFKNTLLFILAICLVFPSLSLDSLADYTTGGNSITLGNAVYVSDSASEFTFPNAVVSFGSNATKIITITVSDGKVKIPDSVGAALSSATKFTDMSEKSVSLIWSGDSSNSVDYIQNILRNITFTYVSGMTITVTIDANETNIVDKLTDISGAKLTQWSVNGHYYLFVPHVPTQGQNSTFLSWREAYDAALDMKLGGKQGYLVTVTVAGEQDYLSNLANTNVWTGATSLLLQASDDSIASKLDGSKKIGNGKLVYQSSFVTKADAWKTASDRRTATSPLIDYYYWAAGPESGQKITVGNGILTLYDNSAAARELNGYKTNTIYIPRYSDGLANESCTAVYAGGAGFNDIPEGNYSYAINGAAQGYFVEFGGWTGHDSIVSDKTCTTTVTLSTTPQNVAYVAANHMNWYSDDTCMTKVYYDVRDTASDDGSRTVYVKADNGYVYTTDHPLTVTAADTGTGGSSAGITFTTTRISDGLYKVTYTIPADKSVTITANEPVLDDTLPDGGGDTTPGGDDSGNTSGSTDNDTEDTSGSTDDEADEKSGLKDNKVDDASSNPAGMNNDISSNSSGSVNGKSDDSKAPVLGDTFPVVWICVMLLSFIVAAATAQLIINDRARRYKKEGRR